MENYNKSNNTHYTCWNTSGVCTALSYVYYTFSSNAYYINLTDGVGVEEALVEMLSADDVNRTNSTIKSQIDFWYERNMLDYTNYLEDTIFCNDRSISSFGGWDPNGGSTFSDYELRFKNYSDNTDLTCHNPTDQFSVSNEKAKLTYPVGLMTLPEASLLNNSNVRKTGQPSWLLSPHNFNGSYVNGANGRYVSSDGTLGRTSVGIADGARPLVSLKSGTEYSRGDGSASNPYVVDSFEE